ncbi:MAG: NAD(P)H-dependent oxidoreductase [Candidatus Nezhaarchaeales archaeon]
MKLAIAYYSRTGYTERVVNELKQALTSESFTVDVYKVLPVKEYSKPLHVNLRLIYDTIFKKGASIKFEPSKPKLSDYDLVVVASPIWIGTLSSPIQEFLKRHATMRSVVVITTSVRSMKTAKIERVVEKLCRAKPMLCANIRDATIRDSAKLKETVQEVVNELRAVTGIIR